MYTYYPFLSHISNDHCISFGHGPELCSPTATRAQWLWGLAPRVVAARGIPGASQRSALGAKHNRNGSKPMGFFWEFMGF